MKKKKKIPYSFFIVCVAAFVLSFAGMMLLPIPRDAQRLFFLALFPILTCIGIIIVSKIKKGN